MLRTIFKNLKFDLVQELARRWWYRLMLVCFFHRLLFDRNPNRWLSKLFLLSIFCAFFKMNIRCARVSWTKQLKSVSKSYASFIFPYKLPYFSRKTWWTCSIVTFFACQKIIKWNTFSIMVFPGLNSVMLLKMKKDTLLGRINNSLPLSNFTLQ